MRDEISAHTESETTATPRHTRHPVTVTATATATTTAAFAIVPLTDALLHLLVPVEAASYPESFREGVEGYKKRLHAAPACPSYVCLQRTRPDDDEEGGNDDGERRHHRHHHSAADVADLVAAGDVTRLRAIGYAITCRKPRRTASALEVSSTTNAANAKAFADAEGGDDVQADTLYIHDVAVHPDFRGFGVAGALWRRIEETRVELKLKRMSLVAVFGASAYWARFGFREVARKALLPDTVRVLEDYGDHAVFMERED